MDKNINFEKSSSQIFPLENESGRPGSNTFQNCNFRFLWLYFYLAQGGVKAKIKLPFLREMSRRDKGFNIKEGFNEK